MPLLQFMPWCHLDTQYRVGDVVLTPFHRDGPIAGLAAPATAWVRLILRSYRTISGFPVSHAALVGLADKELLTDLSDDERAITHELVQLAAFSGLANRAYFDAWGNYCNADCFRLYAQSFADEPTHGLVITRRLGGQGYNSISLAELTHSMPAHVPRQECKLDERLLVALSDHRAAADPDEWARWQNAITCFNLANTDDSTSMYQNEWVLLCSAFEHILDARSDYEDVAERFVNAICCQKTIMAMTAARKADRWQDRGRPLIQEWMREFYRIRGDYAHGRLATRQPSCWQPIEHIVLGCIAFPLLVRSLLVTAGRYAFSDEDLSQLAVFQQLVDLPFLEIEQRDDATDRPRGFWILENGRWRLWTQRFAERIQARLQAEVTQDE